MEVQVLFDSIDLDADDINSGAPVTKDIFDSPKNNIVVVTVLPLTLIKYMPCNEYDIYLINVFA